MKHIKISDHSSTAQTLKPDRSIAQMLKPDRSTAQMLKLSQKDSCMKDCSMPIPVCNRLFYASTNYRIDNVNIPE